MAQTKLPLAVCIMGPTGTGKTDLAVELVNRFPFEVISVDSALVFREMDIGTAKPSKDVLKKVPHRLINLIDPDEVYSAARFRQDALREMQTITKAGNIPLLVGGTGLYFKALLEGLNELPPADPVFRQKLEAEAAELGWQVLHQRLRTVDPEAAKRIHPNDPQRIGRALEVFEITGRSMTSLFSEAAAKPVDYRMIKTILEPQDRAWLHSRLSDRFDQMLEQGLVEEIEGLKKKYKLNADLPSMRMVGYRQVWQHLSGEYAYDIMKEKAVAATRQLAKRQITWLRKEKMASRFMIDREKPLDDILRILKEEEFFLSA